MFALISILLLVGIFQWMHYLITHDYIRTEHFTNPGFVNLPINTTQECKNVCGPMAKCSLTSEQCMTDSDCQGCTSTTTSNLATSSHIPGYDDSGKLGDYSILTSDITRNSAVIQHKKPLLPFQGINVWKSKFNQGMNLFRNRYVLSSQNNYKPQFTMSGEFVEVGPLPANA